MRSASTGVAAGGAGDRLQRPAALGIVRFNRPRAERINKVETFAPAGDRLLGGCIPA